MQVSRLSWYTPSLHGEGGRGQGRHYLRHKAAGAEDAGGVELHEFRVLATEE